MTDPYGHYGGRDFRRAQDLELSDAEPAMSIILCPECARRVRSSVSREQRKDVAIQLHAIRANLDKYIDAEVGNAKQIRRFMDAQTENARWLDAAKVLLKALEQRLKED